jgi:4-hydroxy-tetrahydrodipicolinate reductase
MKTTVCLAGITGWVGGPLAAAIAASDDLDLVAAVSRRAVGETHHGVVVSGSVADALQTPSTVFVEYTSAAAAKENVLMAIEAGRSIVIGSSGLSEDDFSELEDAAQRHGVGVIAVGNFAISAALLQRFAAEAARHFPAWEIIDYAEDTKVDAPSGTARELAWRLGQVGTSRPNVPLEETAGPLESRGATISGSQVHSLRLPGHTIAVEVHFGRKDERLTLRYEGGVGSAPYIAGTLMAIRKVAGVSGLMRGMDELL